MNDVIKDSANDLFNAANIVAAADLPINIKAEYDREIQEAHKQIMQANKSVMDLLGEISELKEKVIALTNENTDLIKTVKGYEKNANQYELMANIGSKMASVFKDLDEFNKITYKGKGGDQQNVNREHN